ncbi:MAG: (2Fe-2S)-binding protein [Rhodobacteraceae bacterium GWE1_64_9]|nr:MAG: (2Fe-2S)-binding protein [Rhodobacteraceae bacterium GWE1_64_9]OHC51086.1 MAG: (2Fe-2S)-binding protein [Rhodobacteraceae bacterium GWF1_65_7]HBU13597.1 (2Fe-2S)-binding protein [Gemmobacter sp.]
MIVCHCMNITDHDIRAAVDWMRASDAETIVTPGKIYHALGKRADCGGCMPLFLDTMRRCESFGVADVPARPPLLRRVRAERG